MLPFLEQQPLFDRFDFKEVAIRQPDATAAAASPSFTICPSDATEGKTFRHLIYSADREFAKGNYAAFCSPTHLELQNSFHGALIGYPRANADITDGMSNTLFVGEVRRRDDERDQRGTWALPFPGASVIAADSHVGVDFFIEAGEGKQIERWDGTYTFDEGSRPYVLTPNHVGLNQDVVFHCARPEDAELIGMPCNSKYASDPVLGWSTAAPRSLHVGGVQAVYLDNHVGFLSDNVDPHFFAQLIAAKDGEVMQGNN